jgi:MFS family permease
MNKINPVFAAACISLLVFGITLITLGSVLPALTQAFSLDGIQTGTLVAVLPVGILCGSLLFGPIADRYGYKFLLAISIFLSAVGLIGMSTLQILPVLYICVFIIGFGGGIINGGTSALVSDISGNNKGANLSLLGVFFGIGALGMPLLLGLLSESSGPSAILRWVGFIMFIPFIFLLTVKFPPAKQAAGLPMKEVYALLTQPALLLTGFFLFFQSGAEGLVNNWSTSFLQGKLHVSNQQSLFALSCAIAGLTAMRILTAFLLKKMTSFQLLTISMVMILTGSLLLYFADSYAIAFAALLLSGLGLSAGFPLVLGFIGQLYPKLSGTAFSIAFVIALTGNILINYLTGILIKSSGINQLPLLTAGCSIVMLIILQRIWVKLRDRQ